MVKSKALWILVAAGFVLALAAPASAGLLDAIEGPFAAGTVPLATTAAKWSAIFFYSTVFFEFWWSFYECAKAQTWESLFGNLTDRLIAYGIGVWAIQNQVTIVQAVIAEIGIIASSFTGVMGGVTLTPDGIAALGWSDSLALAKASSGNIVTDGLLSPFQGGSAFFLQLAFIVVAIEDECAIITTQFCIAVSSLTVGLMATRWGRPFAAIWPGVIFGTLMLLVTVNAVAGLGNIVSAVFVNLIATMSAQSYSGMLTDYVTIGASSVAYMLVALAIPSIALALARGVPVNRAGAAFMSALRSAVVIGAGAGGAGAGAAGAGKSGIGSIEAAAKTAA